MINKNRTTVTFPMNEDMTYLVSPSMAKPVQVYINPLDFLGRCLSCENSKKDDAVNNNMVTSKVEDGKIIIACGKGHIMMIDIANVNFYVTNRDSDQLLS